MFLILATGDTRTKAFLSIEADYLSRLPKSHAATVRILPASKATALTQAKTEEEATQLKALAALPQGAHVFALTENGTSLTSPQLAEKIGALQTAGARPIAFLIGGAAGLTPRIQKACQSTLSLSALTFPHQLVRPLLAEQLYRAHTLLQNHPYHRP